MSSTRAAWYPRSAKTRMPASNSLRIVRRPCARRSRCCAGVPDGPRVDLDRLWSADLYDLATMLPAIAREAARRFADATAYVAPDGWALSYRDLDRVSDEVAIGLARRGLTAGDVLALVLPPSPEYPAAYLAAAKLGAITAGVNDRLTAEEKAALPETAAPRLALAGPGLEPADASNVETVSPARSSDTMLGELRDRRVTAGARRRPRPSRRDRVHVGHDRPAEGRAVRQPTARLHHPDRRR